MAPSRRLPASRAPSGPHAASLGERSPVRVRERDGRTPSFAKPSQAGPPANGVQGEVANQGRFPEGPETPGAEGKGVHAPGAAGLARREVSPRTAGAEAHPGRPPACSAATASCADPGCLATRAEVEGRGVRALPGRPKSPQVPIGNSGGCKFLCYLQPNFQAVQRTHEY